MKTPNTLLIVLAPIFTAAVFAVFSLASIRGDTLMAVALSLGLLLFAVRDYARRPNKILLHKPAALLRPVLPVTSDARQQVGLPGHRDASRQGTAA